MSKHAFYIEPAQWSLRPELTGNELAHARVLRVKEGESVLLYDGEGRAAECRVVKLARKSIQLEIESEKNFPRPLFRPILALALSKAVRRSFFMEKAEELGAWEIWLWQAERSQGKLVPQVAEACKNQLIAGLKQSGNPWLCKVKEARRPQDVIKLSESMANKMLPWEKRAGTAPLQIETLQKPGDTVFVIGPEGGFAPHESELFLEASFLPVSLGQRVLRCETAATLCLALHWWASQSCLAGQ